MTFPGEGLSGETINDYPEIENALRDGYLMRGFRSGGGLRVIRIEDDKGDLFAYGEAPQVEEALSHANLDYKLGHVEYATQYGPNGRHVSYWTGSTETSSPLDKHLAQGSDLDAQVSDDGETIMVTLTAMSFGPDIPSEIRRRIFNTGQSEYFVDERGIKYKIQIDREFGGRLLKIETIEAPDGINPGMYSYTQTGLSDNFAGAVEAAFKAPKIEKKTKNT